MTLSNHIKIKITHTQTVYQPLIHYICFSYSYLNDKNTTKQCRHEVIQTTKERKTGMAFDSGKQLRPEREFLNKQSQL
jgi:hypothetical protein